MKQKDSLFFRIFSSKLFFIVFLFIFIYLSINVYREIRQRLEIKREINNLKREISNLSNENNKLNGLIEYFETEEYVESISREKLGYKKPGEKIIVVTEEESDNSSNLELEEPSEKKESNIKLWWNYFFNQG